MRQLLCILCCFWSLGALARDMKSLLGTHPPEWNVTNWINSEPLQLKHLRGKVVLVRWWTAPHCPYCKASAPALNEFHREFARDDLRVIGFYHHKGDEPLQLDEVKRYCRKYEFEFPVAIDPNWRTLRQWWLNHDEQNWTSVSFLLDKKGIIRHIHPGGQYVKGDDDYEVLKGKIRELLKE